MPNIRFSVPSKSSQIGTTGESFRIRARATGLSALGTSVSEATGITRTSGSAIPAGQFAILRTGCFDHASEETSSAVG